jgi:hypothetical protein
MRWLEYTIVRIVSQVIKFTYSSIVAGCWSLCVEKSRESLPGSVGSGRKRRPQIEQAYSPVHMRLPSRFVMTALRQIFLASTMKAYTDSSYLIYQMLISVEFHGDIR